MIIFKRMDILICLNQPNVQHFVNDVPLFLNTPLMWTEVVQVVNHMDEYKRVICHLNICMLVPYITKQDIFRKSTGM